MKYEIRFTSEAKADLRRIFEIMEQDSLSVQKMAGQFDRLEQTIASLDRVPERFRLYEKEPWHSFNLRVISADNYLVFYITENAELVVTVLRILYGGKDPDGQLNELTGKRPEEMW